MSTDWLLHCALMLPIRNAWVAGGRASASPQRRPVEFRGLADARPPATPPLAPLIYRTGLRWEISKGIAGKKP